MQNKFLWLPFPYFIVISYSIFNTVSRSCCCASSALSPSYVALPYTTQVLWLFGADHQVTEVGAMNIFFVLKKKDGSGTEVRNAGLCAVWA
jgi:hypothetical protein